MTLRRTLTARPPLRFGRRHAPQIAEAMAHPPASLSDELRLFALTFAGGFLFMTVYLA